MNALYLHEHASCQHYDAKGKRLFSIFHFAGEAKDGSILESRPALLFLQRGKLKIQSQGSQNQVLFSGEFILIPPATVCQVEAIEPAVVVLNRIPKKVELCSSFNLQDLLTEKQLTEEAFYPLQANKWITTILTQVLGYTSMSVHCHKLQEYKMMELLYMLRLFYDKASLARFFGALL